MRFKFLLTHTHTYHSTIFIPKIQRGHHLHFNPLFPYTRNIFLIRPIFIVYSQSPDPTKRFFALQSSLFVPPLYTLYTRHILLDLYRLLPLFRSCWIPNKPSNGKGWKMSVASNRRERRSSTGVGRYTQRLLGPRGRKLARVSLPGRFKVLVPRGELISRHNLESFVDRGVSRHR